MSIYHNSLVEGPTGGIVAIFIQLQDEFGVSVIGWVEKCKIDTFDLKTPKQGCFHRLNALILGQFEFSTENII